MPEKIDQLRKALLAVGIDIEPGIVEKPGTRAQTDAAGAHVLRDYLRRTIAVAAERALQVTARIIENVAAAPVDKFQQAEHRVAEAETVSDSLVDVLGTGNAFLHHPRSFVHCERLDAWDDETGCRRAYDRHLADAFQQRFHPCGDRRIGRGAR